MSSLAYVCHKCRKLQDTCTSISEAMCIPISKAAIVPMHTCVIITMKSLHYNEYIYFNQLLYFLFHYFSRALDKCYTVMFQDPSFVVGGSGYTRLDMAKFLCAYSVPTNGLVMFMCYVCVLLSHFVTTMSIIVWSETEPVPLSVLSSLSRMALSYSRYNCLIFPSSEA